MDQPTYLWATRRITPNTLKLPHVGSCKWGENVLVLGKYHAIPRLFWAKVKVAFDFGVLFQVNYPNS